VKETYKKIRDINTNDNYVSVVGRVETISAISSFQRKNGDEGQVARVRLADDSGRIVIVFWDEQAGLIQRLHSNDFMKIVNGRVRENASKALEIHVRKESKGILLDQKPTDIGQPTSVFSKIAALHPGMVNIDVLARVSSIGTVHEFDRSSGGRGRVGEIFLMDETGSIRLSLWGEKTEELKKVTHNDIVLVEGAYTRERFGGVSLNLDKMGVLLINPILEEAESLPLHSATFTTINQLRIGLTVSVKGVIPTLPDVKTVVTRDGRELKVASIRIRDETGEVRASFWRSLAEKFDDTLAGSQIIVRNAYVKPGYIDELELTSGSITDVEIEHPSTEKTNETPNVLKFHLP
jgi:replication factor A1